MTDNQEFRHFGGGRKGLFLVLRYVFIVAASYLLIFQAPNRLVAPSHALMIACALASNVVLSWVSPISLFAWYVEAPILVADTLWVSWALHSTGVIGHEFFLLYFLVLFIAASGDNVVIVILGAVLISAVNVYFMSITSLWTSPNLVLRIVFFFAVALFYSHVMKEIKHERQRADKGLAWVRELEAKVAERTAHLQLLYEQSRAASSAKSAFVANMSHELRTPLNIVIGYTDILLDPVARNALEGEQLIGRIRDAALNLLQLVNSVLDLGKLESGQVPVTVQPILLERLMAQLQCRERVPLAPEVTLRWQLADNLPVLETDAGKLTIVLDNLVNNAIKFTAEGSITVSVRDLPELERVEFRVDDTGPGIDAAHVPLVFQPFHQVDSSSTKRHAGVGLGLAIVDSYIALLGGEVSVQSTLGSGSSFTVRLPYRWAPRHGSSERSVAPSLRAPSAPLAESSPIH
jgi:signal transduction histidine kinase